MVVCFEVVSDGRHCPTQFCSVLTVARISKSAEPLMGMGLHDCGAGAYDFPSLASRVERRHTAGASAAMALADPQ